MDSQIKRGLLDAYVLANVSGHESYGYQIVKDAPPALELSESTLYPILRRLAKQGALGERTHEHNGRLRKYYAITDIGRKQLSEFIKDAVAIEKIIAYIKEGAQK